MKLLDWWIKPSVRWGLAGGLLVGLQGLLVWLSPAFAPSQNELTKPILTLVGIKVLAGMVYVVVVWNIRAMPQSTRLCVWILVVGFVLRAILFASTPTLEDDFYRYFWDGAVTANGVNTLLSK